MWKHVVVLSVIVVIGISHVGMAQPKQVVITASEWSPFSGESLLNGGFLSEIATTAFSKVGYTVELKILPWKRALGETKDGTYDAILGAGYTEERTADFIYPQYAWDIHVTFFAKQGRTWHYQTLADLCPATVGIFRGTRHLETLRSVGCFELKEVNTIQQNIKKLLADRIDLFLDTKSAVEYYLQQEFPDQKNEIVPVRPSFDTTKVYIIFSKKVPQSQQLVDDFDRGIALIKADGTYASILQKHGIALESSPK